MYSGYCNLLVVISLTMEDQCHQDQEKEKEEEEDRVRSTTETLDFDEDTLVGEKYS